MPNTTLETIKDILVLAVTPIALGYMVYKQAIIGKKVDGMTSKLVDAEKGKSNAEGQLAGMEKVKQEVIVAAKVIADAPIVIQPVEVVGQAKPVEVQIKKEDKKL